MDHPDTNKPVHVLTDGVLVQPGHLDERREGYRLGLAAQDREQCRA
jgi:hypothetical protein